MPGVLTSQYHHHLSFTVMRKSVPPWSDLGASVSTPKVLLPNSDLKKVAGPHVLPQFGWCFFLNKGLVIEYTLQLEQLSPIGFCISAKIYRRDVGQNHTTIIRGKEYLCSTLSIVFKVWQNTTKLFLFQIFKISSWRNLYMGIQFIPPL